MKKIIFFGLLIFMIGFVSAIDEGDFISQQQLDNINIDSLTWQNLQCQGENRTWSSGWNLHSGFSCLNLREIPEGYIVYRADYFSSIQLWKIRECLSNQNIDFCRDKYRQEVILQALQRVERIKEQIKQLQTDNDRDEGIRWFRNWNPFG